MLFRSGVTGLSGKGYRARSVEERLIGKAGSEAELNDAASVVADGVQANADIHASSAYRSQLARVATVQALRASLLKAG